MALHKNMFFPRLLKALFVVWIVLWVVFFLRENKQGEYREFFYLAGRDLEGKRAYLMGQDFYGFVKFCQEKVLPGSRYKFAGLRPFAVEEVRAIYYLWPLKAVEHDYDYIFVYGDSEVSEEGFEKIAEMNDNAYILKRT